MSNKKIGIILGAAFIIILLIMGTVYLLDNANRNVIQNSENENQNRVIEMNRNGSITNMKDEEKEAVNTLTTALNLVKTDEKDVLGKLQKIENGDYSVVDEKLDSLLHFSVEAPESEKKRAYQTMITLSSLIQAEAGEIKASHTEAEETTVLSDPETGIVYVEVSAYTNKPIFFTFMLINIDGTWKIDPHGLTQTIKVLEVSGSQRDDNSEPTGQQIEEN